jgi:hypothetical protein
MHERVIPWRGTIRWRHVSRPKGECTACASPVEELRTSFVGFVNIVSPPVLVVVVLDHQSVTSQV